MVEDTLDGDRPGWRLRLAVAWSGLHERAHRAAPKARRWAQEGLELVFGQQGIVVLAGLLYFGSVQDLTVIRLSHQAYLGYGTAAAYALVVLIVVLGLTATAGALAALPALIRFLRAGGWPRIRRRAGWAAGVTAVAAATLSWFFLAAGAMTYDQLNRSAVYAAGLLATVLLLEAVLVLWRLAAKATASQLDLRPRVRAAQILLAAVTSITASVILPAEIIWLGTIQASTQASGPLLGIGAASLFLQCAVAPRRLRRARRRGRRLRSAAARGQ